MSTDSKQELSNHNSKTNENSSPEISFEHKDENQLNSPTTLEKQRTNSRSNSPTTLEKQRTISRSNSPTTLEKQRTNSRSNSPTTLEKQRTNSRSTSSKILRSQSGSSTVSERKESVNTTNEILTQRPTSPIPRHREVKQQNPVLKNQQRNRSNSPRKTFSYLRSDRLNIRAWKEQQRQLAKQQEGDRIYYENRQKLERLAKIAREQSSYPSIHIQQERLRERHATEHRRKVLRSFIPILKDNLCIVDRLANVKGVYDIKKMDEDFARHQQILKQDAANRKKARETAAQRPFILPKINLKS